METPGKNIPRGYHLRLDGSVVSSTTLLECECCHRGYYSLVGIEFDYPEHPDMAVCDQCWHEYQRMLVEEPPPLGVYAKDSINTKDRMG